MAGLPEYHHHHHHQQQQDDYETITNVSPAYLGYVVDHHINTINTGSSNNNSNSNPAAATGIVGRAPSRIERVTSRFRAHQALATAAGGGDDKLSSSGDGSRRQSMKISAKSFISKFSGDLKKYYEIGEMLGEGGYGQVYVCKYKETGAIRAVKIIAKSDFEEENRIVVQEFNILKELDHPNILKNYALFETQESFYIVTDLYKGGELFDQLARGFTEEEAAILMKSVLSCINYCHKQNIVHRDLKPENILLEENLDLTAIKIIDFGLAALFDGSKSNFDNAAGSSYYMSPQVLKGDYNYKCDIWSCGVIAYMVLGGYAPFDGNTEDEIADRIEDGVAMFDHPVWDNISDEALDFIDYLLTYDENDRPTAEEALQHPWMQESRKSVDEELSERDSARLSLASLQSFSASSKLKQCACSLIASQILPKENKQEINRVFQALDLDCDGKLTPEDIKLSYQQNFGLELTDDDIESIFHEVNYSSSGSIQYSEFIVATMLEKNMVTDDMLEVAFQLLDKDGSGQLSFDDLKEALDVDDDMENYVKTRIISPVDSDGDGMISLEDFKAMFAFDMQDHTSNTEEANAQRRPRRMSVRNSFRTSVNTTNSFDSPEVNAHRLPRRMSVRNSFRTSINMTNSYEIQQLELLASESSDSVNPSHARKVSRSTSGNGSGMLKSLLNDFKTFELSTNDIGRVEDD